MNTLRKALFIGVWVALGWFLATIAAAILLIDRTPFAVRVMTAPPCLTYPGASASGAFLAVME